MHASTLMYRRENGPPHLSSSGWYSRTVDSKGANWMSDMSDPLCVGTDLESRFLGKCFLFFWSPFVVKRHVGMLMLIDYLSGGRDKGKSYIIVGWKPNGLVRWNH